MSPPRFSNQHEWIRIDGDIGTIGITDFAQQQLGDVVHVDLPEIGRRLGKGEEAAVVESVKVASEVYSPVSGEISAVNGELAARPELLNQDPFGDGWLMKIKVADPAELQELMSEAQYREFVGTLA